MLRGASNFFYNSNGAEEKYLYSSTSNTAAGGYYILLPNGNIYAWTGALATTLAAGPVGTVPTLYYQNPNLLISAVPPAVWPRYRRRRPRRRPATSSPVFRTTR